MAAAAALIAASVATSAAADACEANLRRVDTFGRLALEAQVSKRPAWAVPHPDCSRGREFCETFVDPEGVVYSLLDEGYIIRKQLDAKPETRLPWGIRRDDTRKVVAEKLGRVLPSAEIRLIEDRGPPLVVAAVPGCEAISVAVEVGPAGVDWVSLTSQI